MKVRDLIAGSTFTPGAARSGPAPRLTVILPTFRRGDDGLLRRALESLLGQSFDDLEVIVVDDASTDSTADVLAEIMRRDGRVSVIRHERNIGLPAVSEFEAYRLARGDLIAFAFDDTVFYRHGLRRLVLEADRRPGTLIAGWVNAFYRDPADGRVRSITFGQNTDESDLLAINHIPNNGVLAPKSVLDAVGLYDPHISVARICDYDLWLRARRRVPISFVAMCIGEEHGPAFSDSLGSTYVLDHWVADDRMRQARDELLSPERYDDADVFDLDRSASARTREIVGRLAAGHIARHPWMTPPVAETPSRRVPRIMVLSHPIDATVQLVFEALRDVPDIHVRMVDPTRRYLGELAAADVLILARRVREDWKQAAHLLGIPAFYYLDDNLPLMAAAGELDGDDAKEFALDALRAAVASLDGVLTSTEALAESFREQGLHESVTALPLSVPLSASRLDPRPARDPDAAPAFALFVGRHRLAAFRRTLWPAFVEASKHTGRTIRVLVPEATIPELRRLADERVRIEPFRSHRDYFSALRELRSAGADAVVVPPARSVNTPYKTLHPLLSATVLDALLLAPASAPYLAVADEPGVRLVERPASAESWSEAIVDALAAIPVAPRRESALARFDRVVGATRLAEAVTARVPQEEPDVDRRVQQISDWLAHQLAVTRSLTYGNPVMGPPGEVVADPMPELYDVLRASRRVHAFRRAPTVLSSFEGPANVTGGPPLRRRERAELGGLLTGLPYLSFRMRLPPGRHRRIRTLIWADGQAGDIAGIEIVDPEGRISLHAVAALPRDAVAEEVVFDARSLVVSSEGLHEVRIFVRTRHPARLIEIVDRGPFGLRRPRARPLLRFETRA
jgi:hypothetical protein